MIFCIRVFSNLKKKCLILSFLIALFNFSNAYCQFSNGFSISGGLNTTIVLGNNPGTQPFAEHDPTKPPLFGGGFSGPQPGIKILFDFPVKNNDRLSVPFGFDYTFFTGLESIPQSYFVTQYISHYIDIATLSLGLRYALLKYQIADAKIFLGLDATSSFISKSNFSVTTQYKLSDSVEVLSLSQKSACTRFGGALSFGIEGQIAPSWYVNINGSFGILNLLGRDNSRGELLTPAKITPFYTENTEQFIYTFHYAFLVQYRL
jgi:hypothetical protein